MAGLMDFLFGRGALQQAAGGAPPAVHQPVYSPATIDMAALAQQQANSQLGPGGVTMVDPRTLGPNMGAPAVGGPGYPMPSRPSLLQRLSDPRLQKMMSQYGPGNGVPQQAPPMQMAPSGGVHAGQPMTLMGLMSLLGQR